MINKYVGVDISNYSLLEAILMRVDVENSSPQRFGPKSVSGYPLNTLPHISNVFF